MKNCVLKASVDTKKWIKAAGVRAVKTMAQTAVAVIGTAAVIAAVDWKVVVSSSIMAGIVSILTSVAGIPEVQEESEEKQKTLIDVSYHNGVIDWGKAKQHIDGAIIRCGYGDNIETQDDTLFKENIEACIAHGIPVGVYLYSYAKTMEQAKSEAEHVIRLVGSYKDKLSYPVYYDLEEAGTETSCVENALVFGEILEREGFWVGIYASESWWNSYIGDSLNRFTKWVAKYGTNDGNMQNMPGINNMDIWQYTSVGSVNG